MTEEHDAKSKNEEKPKITVVDRRHSILSEESEEADKAAQAAEERLPTYVEKLKREAEEKDKRLREYIAAYKENSSATDELRARLTRENENRLDLFKANLFARLVPILDNLKRAGQAATASSDFESLKKGIEMVIRQYTQELGENGVEEIPTAGRKFDPKIDEVYMTIETADAAQDNDIIEELEPGYTYKGKLIKAAKVKVAKLKQ
jgi:molecular chaperone GrpE